MTSFILATTRNDKYMIPQTRLALMGFSRYCPSSLDLTNFVVRRCRRGAAEVLRRCRGRCAGRPKSGPGLAQASVWESGNLGTWKSGNLGSEKSEKKKENRQPRTKPGPARPSQAQARPKPGQARFWKSGKLGTWKSGILESNKNPTTTHQNQSWTLKIQ